MTTTRAIAAVIVLLAMVGLAWLWYQPESTSPINAGTSSSPIISENSVAGTANESDSPFAVQGVATDTATQTRSDGVVTPPSDSTNLNASSSPAVSIVNTGVESTAVDFPDLDLTALGHAPIADEQFNELVERLRADPQLLQQLIDEFRQETNSLRLAELSRLLGEVGGSDVTLVASELIFSGDAQSRLIGLELLQQVQPGNADARDLVSGLLATEVESDVLISTLTTLASPGNVDDTARANLSEQVAYLTEHNDPSVRAISLNILSRWTTDSRYTPVLIGGLDDSVTDVRESAAYALVGHEDGSQLVMDSLMAVIDNEQEDEPVRRGAVLALRGMPIGEAIRNHIASVERKLDSRPR